VVVTYKTPKNSISRLKKEIVSFGIPSDRICIVDNSIHNRGYSGGVNYGIQIALSKKSDYILVCNPDISNLKGSISRLTHLLDQKTIVGGKFNQKNTWYYGGEIDRLNLSGSLITQKPTHNLRPVDFVSGSLMLFSTKTFETVGYFNEQYFMYYEDVEYCIRAKRLGITPTVNMAISYTHHETSENSPIKDYYLTRNRILTLARYGSFKQKMHELLVSPKNIPNIFKKNRHYKMHALRDALKTYI